MSKPNYSISHTRHLILISRDNEWDYSSEIAYLSELADTVERYKRRPFSIVVDMRGWHIPDEIRYGPKREDVTLDRRSQIGECWLLDTPHQADHLLRHFIGVKFHLEHVYSDNEVLRWARQMVPEDEVTELSKWLDEQ